MAGSSSCIWAYSLSKFFCFRSFVPLKKEALVVLALFGLPLLFCPAQSFGQTQMETPGEFQVDPQGGANYSIGIRVSAGTAGMTPTVGLQYRSGAGNGLVGTSWGIRGLTAITRCGRTIDRDGISSGVYFDATDKFCMDGSVLIAVSGTYGAQGTEYRAENEDFTRVISNGTAAGGGPASFTAWKKSGQIVEYGTTADAQVEAQGKSVIRLWAANKISDRMGNYLTVTYTEDNVNGDHRPARIDYTGNVSAGVAPYASVQFAYQPRTDINPGYTQGSKISSQQRLSNIQTYVGATLVKDYRLTYDYGGIGSTSRLTSLTECDGGGSCLPASAFTWQGSTGTPGYVAGVSWGVSTASTVAAGDINGDGRADIAYATTTCNIQQGCNTAYSYRFSTGSSFTGGGTVTSGAGDCRAGCRLALGDINGDGKADLIIGNSIYIFNGTSFAVAGTITGQAQKIVLADINGDGKADLVAASTTCNNVTQVCQSGVSARLWDGSSFALSAGSWNGIDCRTTCPVSAGDVNGDGLADVVIGSAVYLSNGNTVSSSSAFSASYFSAGNIDVADVDGDGRGDLVVGTTTCPLYQSCTVSFSWHRATGYGFVAAGGLGSWLGTNSTLKVADVTGDGGPDLIKPSDVSVFNVTTPQYISKFTTGLGHETSVTHSSISNATIYTPETGAVYPNRDFLATAPIDVVSNVTLSNGIGGVRTLSYTYAGAKVHAWGRGFLGFRKVTTKDVNLGTSTATTYSQVWPTIGMPTLMERFSPSNTYLSQTNNTYNYTNFGNGRYFVWLASTTVNNWDLNGTPFPTVTTTTEYNEPTQFGNPTKVTTTTSDGFTKANYNVYSNDTTNWILARLTCSAVTSSNSSGATQTRTASFSYFANGMLNQEIVEPGVTCGTAPIANTDSALRVITTNAYDSFGNKTSATVSSVVASTYAAYFAPRATTTSYAATTVNPVAGRFPTSSTNALSQSESREFDNRFGSMTKLIGPNGLATTWNYDNFGRKYIETRVDGTTTQFVFTFCNVGACLPWGYRISTVTTGQPYTIAYFDILNRVVRTRTQSLSGAEIVVDATYDSLGRKSATSRPFYDGQPVYNTTVSYDALGRVLTSTAANNLATTFGYNGLTTTVSVANSTGVQTTSKTVNSQGWTTSTTDAAAKITSFTYDPNGNLLTTTDPKLNKITLIYDQKGRKTGMVDPDMGAWSYSYDALGQLKSQTDAKGQITSMTYDLLGRMTNRFEPSFNSTWSYDKYADNSACNKGVGKLCEVTATNTYRRKHYYDNLGRSNRADYYHDSITSFYQIDNTFDSAGRVDTVTYPSVTIGTSTSRLQVKNNYNAIGYLFKITDLAGTLSYWTATAMDAEGHITIETLGNGLSTTRTYQGTTGRLTAINTGTSGSVQNLTYTYDTIGNLTARTDTFTTPSAATINETYIYDVLNRLKTVNMTGTTTLSKSYNYDDIGNIIYKSDIGGTGVLTYPPSGATSVRPHAVTSINGNIGGAPNVDYTYDANGNMATAIGGTRVLTYASFNLPTRSIRNGNYIDWIYDADHNRTQQLSNTGTTGQAAQIIYVNPGNQPFFEKHVNIAGVTEYRHFIAGVAIYTQKSNATNETKYLLKDRLGSTNVVTNSAGGVLERYSFDAFGKTRNLNGSDVTATDMPTPSIRRGFTGHEMLSEFSGGFIHMNGRIYDPNLGRFMQADPHIQLADYSQSYNRYAYLFNNPLGGADPSGFFAELLPLIGAHQSVTSSAIEDVLRNPGELFNWYALEHSLPGRAFLDRHVFSHDWGQTIGHLAISVGSLWCGAAAVACVTAGEAHIAGYNTWLNGGDHDDVADAVISAGAITFISAAGSRAIGGANLSPVGNILAHAALGCAIGEASGGTCGQGALSHGITAAVDIGTQQGGVLDTRGFLGNTGGFFGNMAVAVAAGCLSSHAGGGTCQAGIRSSAIIYLYNASGGELNTRSGPVDQSGRVPRTGAPIESYDAEWYRPGPLKDRAVSSTLKFLFEKITGIPIIDSRISALTTLMMYSKEVNLGEHQLTELSQMRGAICRGGGICSH